MTWSAWAAAQHGTNLDPEFEIINQRSSAFLEFTKLGYENASLQGDLYKEIMRGGIKLPPVGKFLRDDVRMIARASNYDALFDFASDNHHANAWVKRFFSLCAMHGLGIIMKEEE